MTEWVDVSLQVMDELLPKATGKDAKAEKRRLRAEQRKEREVSPGIR